MHVIIFGKYYILIVNFLLNNVNGNSFKKSKFALNYGNLLLKKIHIYFINALFVSICLNVLLK